MKKLKTGVKITYKKDGSIESIYSPYWRDIQTEKTNYLTPLLYIIAIITMVAIGIYFGD